MNGSELPSFVWKFNTKSLNRGWFVAGALNDFNLITASFKARVFTVVRCVTISSSLGQLLFQIWAHRTAPWVIFPFFHCFFLFTWQAPPLRAETSQSGMGLLLLLLSHFSCVRLCATPQMAAHRAPPSLGFSRQEHWSGLPFLSPMHESEKWKWSCSVVSDS